MEHLKHKLNMILESNLVKEIEESGTIISYKEGDVIIDYDKSIRSMPIVLSGTIRVMRKDEEGREILLYYLSNNESCAMAYTCCMEARKSEIKAIFNKVTLIETKTGNYEKDFRVTINYSYNNDVKQYC